MTNPQVLSDQADDACPAGGRHDPVKISYGYPSGEMFEAVERGEIFLGGCVMSRSSPTSRCRKCGTEQTSEGGPPLDGLAGITFGDDSPQV